MELKNINGRKLIELMNSKEGDIEDLKDETLYYHFEYEKQYIEDGQYVLEFAIDDSYYIKGNRIYIQADGTVDSRIEEPYDSGSQWEEIESIVKVYLKQLEVDIRDNRIAIALDEGTDERSRLKASIIGMIGELNDIVAADEISEEDPDDLLTLADLEADLKAALGRVLDKI